MQNAQLFNTGTCVTLKGDSTLSDSMNFHELTCSIIFLYHVSGQIWILLDGSTINFKRTWYLHCNVQRTCKVIVRADPWARFTRCRCICNSTVPTLTPDHCKMYLSQLRMYLWNGKTYLSKLKMYSSNCTVYLFVQIKHLGQIYSLHFQVCRPDLNFHISQIYSTRPPLLWSCRRIKGSASDLELECRTFENLFQKRL